MLYFQQMKIIAEIKRRLTGEKPVAVILIGLGLLVSSFKFIVGLSNTHPGVIYLGTTHVANDYMYYLSQVIQGRERWFCGEILQTTDYPGCTLVGWGNVLSGRLFMGLGLNQIWAYQL